METKTINSIDSLYSLLQTSSDWHYFLLRVVAGIIILPYGMQKLFGWFNDLDGGVGVKQTLAQMAKKNIPRGVAWLVIVGQCIGSIALILGVLGRTAALGNFIIFAGALFVHSSDGWAMNWTSRKKGEGIEYFVLLLSILLVIAVKGSGPLSIDYWICSGMK